MAEPITCTVRKTITVQATPPLSMCSTHGQKKKKINTFTRDGHFVQGDRSMMEAASIHRTGNALINQILQQYRDISNDSISGPNRLMNSTDKKRCRAYSDVKQRGDVASRESSRKVTYAVKMPPKDQNGLKFKETLIDGVSLVCFSFGGEKRLCFNELLTKVLKDFSSQEISVLQERLQIFCPRCTPHQMELFKIAGVLPWPCSMANLISKSDAFRLLGSLTSTRVPRRSSRVFSVDSLEVYHECFGGCVGMLEIELYSDPYSNCITCSQCDGVFSPRTFVTHGHSSGESHTCHWGFDSSKWRLYLMLCNEHPTLKMKKLWEMLTNKSSGSSKRKGNPELLSCDSKGDVERDSAKRVRADEANLDETFNGKDNAMERAGSGTGIISRRSAFRPWSPLQNRVKAEGMEIIEQQGSPRLPIPIPARLFAPHTIPYMSSECPYPTPRSAHYTAQFQPEITAPETLQVDETPTNSRMGVITSTPSTKDPHSLEKTAREMLEVARNEKWEALSTQPLNEQSSPRNAVKFLEENIYKTLMNCMESGQLPSARSLSSLIAQNLGEDLARQEITISEMSKAKEKLEKEVDSLKENHARKMEEAFDELKNTQKNLRLLETRHREEGQELNNVIFKLKQEAKALNAEKKELLSRNEKEAVLVLKQEVRELSIKLQGKESYCSELQNELRALHAWIDSQTRPVKHSDDGLKNSESVIRTLYLVNGNATSKHQNKTFSKENGVGPNSVESSEEESSQLVQF